MADHDGSIIIDTGLDNEGFKKDSDKLLTAVEKLTQKVDALGVGMKNSFSGLSGVLQSIAAASQAQAAAMAQSTQQSNNAAAAQSRVGKATSTTGQAAKTASKEVQALQKELAKVEKQLLAAEKNLAGFYAELDSIRQGTDEMLQQCETTEQVNTVLEIEKVQTEALNQKYAAQLAALKQLELQQGTLHDKIAEAQAAEIARAEQLAAEQARMQEEARQNEGALQEQEATHTMTFLQMIDNVRKYAKEARKATIDSNKLVKSLLRLKTMLIARIKRMFISAIFNGVRENMAMLRKYYVQYGAAMDRIQAATQRTGGNVAIAIAHLVITAEPFITKLINLLNKALERLNTFFALLRGVKDVKYDEFAAMEEAAEAAAEAQERLNADMYEFDELNRQSGNVGEPSESDGPGISDTLPGEQENGWLTNIKDNLGSIAKIAAGVAAAFAAWKIGSAILKALGRDSLGAKLRLAGLALALGGATVYALNFIDAWKNGLSNSNINGMLGSTAVMAAGLGILFKSLKGAAVGLAVGGFGMIVAGAREWIKTGELTNNAFKSIEIGIAGLAAGIALFTGSWIPLLVGAVVAAGLAIYKNWDTIKEKFKELGQSLKEEGARIKETFRQGWEELKNDFANIGTFLQGIWTGIVEGVRGFWTWLTALWAEIWAGLQTIWITIVTGIQTAWTWIVTSVTEFFMQLQVIGQQILMFLQELWNNIILALQTAWTWITTAIQTFVNTCVMLWTLLWQWAQTTFDGIKSAVMSAVTIAVQWATEKWNDLKAHTIAVFTTVKTFIQNAMQTAKTSMTTAVTTARTAVVAQWNALKASCTAIFTSVKTTIVTMIHQAASFLANQSWYGYGVQLMQGFWNGLRSLMSAIWQSVCDFVRRCADAVRSALRIGSPSKVFAEIGEYTGEGFIVGLESEQGAAIKTAQNLATAVQDGVSGSIGDISVTSSGLAQVVSSLKQVASIFNTIAGTLNTINFSVPQISSGSVTPYRTRVNEDESYTGKTENYLASILALLQTLADNSGKGETSYQIIANGREIFELVIDENNRAIQRTGASPIRV